MQNGTVNNITQMKNSVPIKKRTGKKIVRRLKTISENTTVKLSKFEIQNGSIVQFVPIELSSLANTQEHWTTRSKRIAQIKKIIKMILNKKFDVCLPVEVTLTRCGTKKLDYDNLVYCFKSVRDAVADVIIANAFNLPCIDSRGQYDGDTRISWRYEQEQAEQCGFRISIKSS
jgi:hypothetical protein